MAFASGPRQIHVTMQVVKVEMFGCLVFTRLIEDSKRPESCRSMRGRRIHGSDALLSESMSLTMFIGRKKVDKLNRQSLDLPHCLVAFALVLDAYDLAFLKGSPVR
jgi:hypothetical protein